MSSNLLPKEFKDLEAFVSEWALVTESERVKKRYSSTMEEIKLFYDAMLPQLETILEYLNRFSLDELPEAEKRLLYLTYSSSRDFNFGGNFWRTGNTTRI